MKIAFLSDSIYPFNKGGKETRLYDLTKKLAKKGHEIHVYTMNFWEGPNIIEKQGIYLHGICKNYPLYNNKTRSIKQGIMFGLASLKLLKENFDVLDADHMVYFHLFPAKLACLIKRKPLIITWHEVWGLKYWLSYLGKKGILGYSLERLSSFLPNKIISISKHTTDKLVDYLRVNPKKIITIPNAIDIKKIQSIKPNKEKSDIIFAGRLLGNKNVNVLIRAISIIKKSNPEDKAIQNIKCMIIGDGPEKSNLQHLTSQLNLKGNIIFKGFIEKLENVHALIKSSKVFALPSTREGFGIAVIEANACGIPVITINHKDNAAKDLIKTGKNNQNGFLCKLNEKQLAKTIIQALKNSKNMKTACINQAKQYDWSNIIGKFEEVYGG